MKNYFWMLSAAVMIGALRVKADINIVININPGEQTARTWICQELSHTFHNV